MADVLWMLPASLWQIHLQGNEFTGGLPMALFSEMRSRLGILLLSENLVTGSFPTAAPPHLGGSLDVLHLGGNFLEGSLPYNLFKKLSSLSQFHCGDMALEGQLPLLSPKLRHFVAHRNQLTGDINQPRVSPIKFNFMGCLVLHENALESITSLFVVQKRLTLHRNALSCRLPGLVRPWPSNATIGMGNQFTHPANFPQWVMKAEQSGLFWVSKTQHWKLLAQALAAGGVLVACVCTRQKLSGPFST